MNDRQPNSSMDTAVGFAHRSSQTMTVGAPPAEVYAALFDMGRWADRLVHVTGIDVHYDDGRNQEFHMTVESGDDVTLTVRSVRCCHDGVIDFFQPVPPPYLTHHGGTWRFSGNHDGTTDVEVTHVWNLGPEAPSWFPAGPSGSTADQVRQVLAEHSRLALSRWRDLFAGTVTGGSPLQDIGESLALADRSVPVRSVRAEAEVDAPAADVYEVYADIAEWPRHFDSVLAAELTYDDGYNQEFTMTVEKDGRIESVRGVRYLRRPGEMEMCHFTPPPGMATFRCRRDFSARHDGTTRVSELREFGRAAGSTSPEGYENGLRELLEQRIRDAALVAAPRPSAALVGALRSGGDASEPHILRGLE